MEELISVLLNSRTQTHIWHLRVQGDGAFAQHKALEAYYTGIVPLIDALAESYQGKYGIMDFKSMTKIDNDASLDNMIAYFEKLCRIVESHSEMGHEGFIQNHLDEISGLLYSTKYKLKNLG